MMKGQPHFIKALCCVFGDGGGGTEAGGHIYIYIYV